MNQVINYTDFAMESSIESLKMMNQQRLIHLSMESEFILECMDCGIISPDIVLEAEAGKSSIFQKVQESIKAFFKKVLGLFRDRSKEKAEKYVPWIKENIKSIKSRSENMTIELTPYWKTDWKDDVKTMTSTVTKIFDNIKNEKYEDFSFAKDLVTMETSVSGVENLKDKLIVRFSIGEKDKTKMEQVKVEKFGSTDTIDKMIEYTLNYASEVPNSLSQLEKDIERKLDQIKPKTLTIKESTFFDIEDVSICESDLTTLINFNDILMEAGEDKDKGTVNSDGEKTSDTSVKINPDGNDGEGKPEEGKESTDGGESNETRSNYISQCESFMKTMVTAFLTASEKRFVVYTNTMVAIGNSTGSPSKDEEGKVEDKKSEGEDKSKDDGFIEDDAKKKESLGGKIKSKIANSRAKKKKK